MITTIPTSNIRETSRRGEQQEQEQQQPTVYGSASTNPIDLDAPEPHMFAIPITSGSIRAHDIDLLHSAFCHDERWTTWTILRIYKAHENNPNGSPPFAASWTELMRTTTPTFDATHVNTSEHSPTSPSATNEAKFAYNAAVCRMIAYERNLGDPNVLPLLDWFASAPRLNDIRFHETTFLAAAFNEDFLRVFNVAASVQNDFFATWAELEVSLEYNNPLFFMGQGGVHPASPFVTGRWRLSPRVVQAMGIVDEREPRGFERDFA